MLQDTLRELENQLAEFFYPVALCFLLYAQASVQYWFGHPMLATAAAICIWLVLCLRGVAESWRAAAAEGDEPGRSLSAAEGTVYCRRCGTKRPREKGCRDCGAAFSLAVVGCRPCRDPPEGPPPPPARDAPLCDCGGPFVAPTGEKMEQRQEQVDADLGADLSADLSADAGAG